MINPSKNETGVKLTTEQKKGLITELKDELNKLSEHITDMMKDGMDKETKEQYRLYVAEIAQKVSELKEALASAKIKAE